MIQFCLEYQVDRVVNVVCKNAVDFADRYNIAKKETLLTAETETDCC